jgi:hypothetical protein
MKDNQPYKVENYDSRGNFVSYSEAFDRGDYVEWVNGDPISDAIYKEATLYVPRGSIEAYKSAEDWCRFINIVAMTDHFDVNGDDEVTIADVNSVIEVIQHGSNDQFNTSNCDVNDDGEVTIADINAIINAIIGI